MKWIVRRLIFVGFSTIILVFFSEKAYWYVQEYELFGLVLYYAFPVYACFWALEHFRVQRLSGIVLIAALYAFLIEGVLTIVMYEDGLISPFMPSYFIGWHGLLSLVFGWYALRKWLREGRWRRILVSSMIFGLFWGIWSLTFWLPESFEGFENPGQWPNLDFALYTFLFTGSLALSHWLLGRGVWVREFKPSKIERWIVLLALLALFGLTAYSILPVAIFKLGILLGLLFVALHKGRGSRMELPLETVFSDLAGSVDWIHVLPMFAMPLIATGVYSLAASLQPSESGIRALLEGIPVLQALLGAGVFVWALFNELWLLQRRLPVD